MASLYSGHVTVFCKHCDEDKQSLNASLSVKERTKEKFLTSAAWWWFCGGCEREKKGLDREGDAGLAVAIIRGNKQGVIVSAELKLSQQEWPVGVGNGKPACREG